MKVDLYCFNCVKNIDDPDESQITEMTPNGNLYVNMEGTQSQAYRCADCGCSILVSINTLKEQ